MTLNVQQSIFSEIADFLVSQPALEALATYEMPLAVQQRVEMLLDKNQEGGLLPEERLELEKILAVADVMNLAKVKAKLKLAGKA